jgi:hypothetical protein
MPQWLSRFVSVGDALSALGYSLFLAISRLQSPPMPPPSVSLLASGMLAIYRLASDGLRSRNAERNPNLRVAFWAAVAVVSAIAIVA